MSTDSARFLALRDRAYAFISANGTVSETELLAHVYGGSTPAALGAQLTAPLRGDPRFQARGDGLWTLADAPRGSVFEFTALALATTGPSPTRGRIVCVAALAVEQMRVVERFMATVNPGVRVPRYVADRLGLDPTVLEGLQPFEAVLAQLERFLGTRAVVAQDVALTWAFLVAEARRIGRVIVDPPLIDLNEMATRALPLDGKPTLGRVAEHLGVSTVKIGAPEEEARVIVAVANRLLTEGELERAAARSDGRRVLQQSSTTRMLPDRPGIYTFHDADQRAVYVGKARRLRSRVGAYVHRPLGATRRLEGLVGAVERVEPRECDTDLEALVLEDREIRRLEPRFNTVRQSREPRLWIRLPPPPDRGRAPRRLELGTTPDHPGEYIGPFRNETAANQCRVLARDVFELDGLRRGDDMLLYERRLAEAWAFLHGERPLAVALARRSHRLLRRVLRCDVQSQLLPADPRSARYAVVRPCASGVEVFLLDRCTLTGWRVLDDPVGAIDVETEAPRTAPEDAHVVLRWIGAQRPPSRVVYLPEDPIAATDAIQDAALALWEARAASGVDLLDAFGDPVLDSDEFC